MESFIKEDNLQVTSPQIDFYEDYVGRLERVNTRDRLAFIVVLFFFCPIWASNGPKIT